ncbi:uncharacterized protein MCAP_0864-like [Thunnus thynnus]|uniref:uncharacterized protein MCAP_0864-like n=1 Tax=Thunnus thynnus TaxID=8237 RepID=UPI0035287A5B
MDHILNLHMIPSLLVFVILLQAPCSEGQFQVVVPSQPIVAIVGDDIILPCQLEPAINALDMTVEWARPDLNPRFVYVWRDGVELESKKHLIYKGRTSVSVDKLKHGDVSLKLSRVKLSDQGRYRCFIPTRHDSFIELVVGVVSLPAIVSINRTSSAVVLQCVSKGWNPEPEVFWLDGEGNLLSAGPTETVRGPDDLYTVSSRVTVEKRHNNNFTCRVQQNNINQTRETHIQISDDFFKVQSSSSTVTTGLVVCIVLIVAAAVFFFGWKWRQNMIKTKTSCEDEIDGGGRNVTEMQCLNEGTDRDTGDEGAATRSLISPCNWQIIKKQTLQDEQQRREEAENKVQTLTEELETKNQQIEAKQTEIKKLQDENKKLQMDRDTKINQLKEKQDELLKEKQNREKAESEVKNLKDQQSMKGNEIEDKQTEIKKLQDENKKLQMDRDTKINQLKKKQDELLKEKQDRKSEVTKLENQLASKETEIQTLTNSHEESSQHEEELKEKQDELLKEKQKLKSEVKTLNNRVSIKEKQIQTFTNSHQESERELKAQHEKEIQSLKSNNQELERQLTELKAQHEEELDKKQDELLKDKQDREKAESEVTDLKNQLESRRKEAENRKAECDLLKKLLQLHEDNQRTMEDLLTMKKHLETKKEEVHLFI